MKSTWKKVMSALLVLAMLVGVPAVPVQKAEAKTIDYSQVIKTASNPSTVSLGKETSFEITQSEEVVYAAFTPSVDSRYNFCAESDEEIYCSLYSEEDESDCLDYDYGYVASFDYYLEAGVKYIIGLEFASDDYTGDIRTRLASSASQSDIEAWLGGLGLDIFEN